MASERQTRPIGVGFTMLKLEPPGARVGSVMRPGPVGIARELHLDVTVPDLPFPADFQLRSDLLWTTHPDYLAFRSEVLAGQVLQAKHRGRKYVPTIAASELEVVEKGQQMLREAADACRRLLAAAREAAGDATGIAFGALSGYRAVEKERGLWNGYFEKYYQATRRARGKLPGGPHGRAAVAAMVAYVSSRKAAPGYSNHSAGTAMDFWTKEPHKPTCSASMSQKESWHQTWFFGWMQKNAAEFDFHPYTKEPWHWEHRP